MKEKKLLKRVNSDIKIIAESVGIENTVTTYVARHSYATAISASGVTNEMIGQSLGHNDLKTTEIYLADVEDPTMDELINGVL